MATIEIKENVRESVLVKFTIMQDNKPVVKSLPIHKFHQIGLSDIQGAYETLATLNASVENFSLESKRALEHFSNYKPVESEKIVVEKVRFVELVDGNVSPQKRTVKAGTVEVYASYETNLATLTALSGVSVVWTKRPERGRNKEENKEVDLLSILE